MLCGKGPCPLWHHRGFSPSTVCLLFREVQSAKEARLLAVARWNIFSFTWPRSLCSLPVGPCSSTGRWLCRLGRSHPCSRWMSSFSLRPLSEREEETNGMSEINEQNKQHIKSGSFSLNVQKNIFSFFFVFILLLIFPDNNMENLLALTEVLVGKRETKVLLTIIHKKQNSIFWTLVSSAGLLISTLLSWNASVLCSLTNYHQIT